MSGRGSGSEDDAIAPTVAMPGQTVAERSSRPAIESLLPGAVVGRYRLKARLGAGAMGIVWSAHDPKLDRLVALKLVHAGLASEESAERLRREAKAMAKLSHRSVITVYDVDEVDDQLFIAMELVRGTTLGSLLRERDDAAIADWPRWLAIMIEAGQGLAEAHRNGVLHRDFKPDNVLVDAGGRVCVGDFGLATLGESIANQSRQWNARAVAAIDATATSLDLTTTGALLGTPVYMGPQQLRGETIDARGDQFAFCVATWEALYGTRPFVVTERGLEAIVALITAIENGPPQVAGSPVPEHVRAVLVRGLAVDPAARWPDMDVLIAELEQSGRRRATVIKPTAPRRWPILVALAAFAAAAVAVVLWSANREPEVTGETAPPPRRQPTLTKLFGSPLNTRTAISPSGKKIALGSDVVEVRNLDGTESKSIPLPQGIYGVYYLDIDDREIRFSIDDRNTRWRWRYDEEPNAVVDVEDIGGRWRGTTVAGELIAFEDRGLGLVRGGKLERWSDRAIDIYAISPDRRRVAYVVGGRFTGHIVVRDVATDQITRGPMLDEPTSVTWLDNTTLVYATSTLVRPRISRVKVAPTFGEPEVIYAAEWGWFSDLAVGGGQLYVVSMPPSPRGRVIRRGASTGRTELDSVSLGLGWDARDRVVTWNAGNQKVGPSEAGRPALASEPVNATMAGDVLIASLRDLGGRNIVAVSLADGTTKWTTPTSDKKTFAVRCAGDHAPPCFAIRMVRDDLDQIVGIDPSTGTLSSTVLYEARRIEDIAVRADGARILVTGSGELFVLDPSGALVTKHVLRDAGVPINLIRSIAYDPKGGVLLAGTIGRNTYQVGHLTKERYEVLDDARDKILSLVRPSSDGSQVVFIARGYEPELFRIQF